MIDIHNGICEGQKFLAKFGKEIQDYFDKTQASPSRICAMLTHMSVVHLKFILDSCDGEFDSEKKQFIKSLFEVIAEGVSSNNMNFELEVKFKD